MLVSIGKLYSMRSSQCGKRNDWKWIFLLFEIFYWRECWDTTKQTKLNEIQSRAAIVLLSKIQYKIPFNTIWDKSFPIFDMLSAFAAHSTNERNANFLFCFLFDLQNMNKEHRPPTMNSSFEEISRLNLLANIPLPANASKDDEMRQLNLFLRGLRDLNELCCDKNARMQQTWKEMVDKKDAAFSAVQREKENLSTILMSAKANYLGELLDAERTIKKLENELNELKSFIARDVLVANESVSKMIRLRYGDGNQQAIASTAVTASVRASELAKTIEPNTESSPQIVCASIERNPAVIPAAVEVHIETWNQGEQQPTAGETTADGLPENVVEITDDEQMETDDENLLKRFPCDNCSRSFSTMALKFRHESRVHGNTHDIEQPLDKVEKVKKPLKRLRRNENANRIHQVKRILEGQGILEILLGSVGANSTPSTVKRTKKVESN